MNVCPGEGMAYNSYYNETDRVTCNVDAALDCQLSIYLTLAIFDIYAQRPFLLI